MTGHSLVADEWRQQLAQAGLPDLRVLLDERAPSAHAAGSWQILTKPGLVGRQRWRWELDGKVLYVKRYFRPPLSEQFDRLRRQAAGHSRAWWEYQQSHLLARQHLPAARAVAVAEKMFGIVEQSSVVILEAVAGEACDRLWLRLRRENSPLTRGLPRHDLTRRLARLVSAFHQTGFCHRDLYLCHVFVALDPNARQPPQLTLIDLARVHRPRWRRLRWILKDLSQLDSSARQVGASRADRVRFLLTYLGLQPGAPRTRWFARRVVRRSDRILRRIARKSREA